MGLHAPLVFLGQARMGILDKVFLYGQPWTAHRLAFGDFTSSQCGDLEIFLSYRAVGTKQIKLKVDGSYAWGVEPLRSPIWCPAYWLTSLPLHPLSSTLPKHQKRKYVILLFTFVVAVPEWKNSALAQDHPSFEAIASHFARA
jgi:hypothetical protein